MFYEQFGKIEELNFPVDGYKYNVQIWRTVDGKNYYYTGNGKYFKTLAEAEKYANDNTII